MTTRDARGRFLTANEAAANRILEAAVAHAVHAFRTASAYDIAERTARDVLLAAGISAALLMDGGAA